MNTYTQEFKSMAQFYQYICDTPFNDAFRWASHQSVESNYQWYKTNSFEEAVELMRNGWTDMAEKLTQMLKAQPTSEVMRTMQSVIDVQGFQPVVPLFLAGVPQNMVSKRMVAKKQKVINITKLINYSVSVSSDEIIEESVKAMQIVKKLEAMQYRVNLNIAFGSEKGNTRLVTKIRLKSANEKLNVSKLAFPLVHPSMLRRLMFRYIEVYPHTTERFVNSYGRPVGFDDMRKEFPNDIVLPSKFETDVEQIHTLEDLVATV